MPPNFFHKPETALKRAQELVQVGKEADALETLHDTIKARRHKQWTQIHEQIMLRHMELCVTLKKPHVAKDALFQYKTLTQQIAVKSLETVIEHFLTLAETKTEEAQKTSIEKVEEIDDLDQGDVPETLLLSVVSGAAAQDRMDRTVLAPWLRFLWDSYRNCLELLRNNAQVEHLYHRITRQSFQFCAKYQRRTEFRKLCDLLRLHLNQIQKHQHLTHVVKLTSPESLAMMQESRLCQLDTAIQMELWQEAYRSAEDVHGMMQLSKDKDKKMVKPASYVNYYEKLALVFWKAGNSLFHAAALLQKFVIYKDMKRLFTPEEAQEQASRVLLATLAIPDGADAPSDLTRHLDIEDQHIGNIRLLSNLLRLPIAPTRAGLLKEAARLNLPDIASETVQTLYRLLENNFAPLRLAQSMEAELAAIERPDHQQYVESLRVVVATKALKQISVIYDSISWARIQKIIPFYSEMELERLVVDVSKHRFVKAQIDHRSGCVRFGAADATLAGGVDLEEADGFTGDDTQLGVEGIRAHLELMYSKLRSTVDVLDGDKRRNDMIEKVHELALSYEHNRQREAERIMMRRRKIENYKETSELAQQERTRQAQAEQQRQDEARRAEEMKRLEQENIESEKRRKQAEQDEVQRKIKQDQLRKMQQTAIYQAIIREKGDRAFHEMDPEAVIREQRERLDKERMETQKRLQQQEKLFDHHVRALHLEEMKERSAIMQMRLAEAPKLHEEFEKKRVEKAIEDREQALTTWERIASIKDEADDWISSVKMDNQDDFTKKIAAWEAKVAAVRSSRLAERAEQRKKDRRQKWLQAKADEERHAREIEEMRIQKLVEEQKRNSREARVGGMERRRMEDADSSAMKDDKWRVGAAPKGPAPTRPFGGERENRGFEGRRDNFGENRSGGGYGGDRDRGGYDREDRGGFDRPREREPIAPSAADKDTSWRRRDVDSAPPPAPFRDRGAMDRRDPRDMRDGPPRGAPPPSAAPEGAWQRGSIVKKEAPPPSPVPTPAAAAPTPGGGKYIPVHMRNRQPEGGAAPANDGGFTEVVRGGPSRPAQPAGERDFGDLRRGAPPPQRRDDQQQDGQGRQFERRTGPPPSRGAGADNERNWRAK